ncbi:MAG TPA: methyltransferase [Puia sp.]|nr:methyltransferase [Puia sp.]
MSNTYFQFKQFTIHQQRCVMKVCTDACIFGAWIANKITPDASVLDIGSGTGLLMLMLAQKNSGQIDGIELEPACFGQLQENIVASPWKDRLGLFHGDVGNYPFSRQYDFIISNPPFYESDLQSASTEKNLAKHSMELSLEELLDAIDQNLVRDGSFGVLLPFHRTAYFETLAFQKGFKLKEKLLLRQTNAHEYFRSVLHFSRENAACAIISGFVIRNEDGGYTGAFKELMGDYYL